MPIAAGNRALIQQLANIITAANAPGNPIAGGITVAANSVGPALQMAQTMLGALGFTKGGVVFPEAPSATIPQPPTGTLGLNLYQFPDDETGPGSGGELAWLTGDQVNAFDNLKQGSTRVRFRFLVQALVNLIEDVNIAIALLPFPPPAAGNETLALLNHLKTPTTINQGKVNFPGNFRPAAAQLANFVHYLDHPNVKGYLSPAQIVVIRKSTGTPAGAFGSGGGGDGEPLGCCGGTANVPQACCAGTWKQGPC